VLQKTPVKTDFFVGSGEWTMFKPVVEIKRALIFRGGPPLCAVGGLRICLMFTPPLELSRLERSSLDSRPCRSQEEIDLRDPMPSSSPPTTNCP